MKLQVVLDTNVWIAAFRSKTGASRRVTDLVIDGEVEMHLTVPLVAEYEEVLRRQQADIGVSEEEITRVLDLICQLGKPHKVHYLWRWQVSDPEDAHVLEAAVAASCSHLITFNKRDLREAEYFGIEVVTPGEFLLTIKGGA